jgi:polygalacturonase
MNKLIIILITVLLSPLFLFSQYNIKEFGAKGDGVTLDTRSIQNAIDKAYESKGVVIDVPAGIYKLAQH